MGAERSTGLGPTNDRRQGVTKPRPALDLGHHNDPSLGITRQRSPARTWTHGRVSTESQMTLYEHDGPPRRCSTHTGESTGAHQRAMTGRCSPSSRPDYAPLDPNMGGSDHCERPRSTFRDFFVSWSNFLALKRGPIRVKKEKNVGQSTLETRLLMPGWGTSRCGELDRNPLNTLVGPVRRRGRRMTAAGETRPARREMLGESMRYGRAHFNVHDEGDDDQANAASKPSDPLATRDGRSVNDNREAPSSSTFIPETEEVCLHLGLPGDPRPGGGTGRTGAPFGGARRCVPFY